MSIADKADNNGKNGGCNFIIWPIIQARNLSAEGCKRAVINYWFEYYMKREQPIECGPCATSQSKLIHLPPMSTSTSSESFSVCGQVMWNVGLLEALLTLEGHLKVAWPSVLGNCLGRQHWHLLKTLLTR